MTIMACTLRYSRTLATENTWHLNATGDGIEARVRVASGPDVPIVVRLYFRGGKRPDAYCCRPIDESTFVISHGIHSGELPRLEIVLLNAPGEAAEVLRAL